MGWVALARQKTKKMHTSTTLHSDAPSGLQVVAQGLPSCAIVMRVLKDICRRVPAWGVLDSWVSQLHAAC